MTELRTCDVDYRWQWPIECPVCEKRHWLPVEPVQLGMFYRVPDHFYYRPYPWLGVYGQKLATCAGCQEKGEAP